MTAILRPSAFSDFVAEFDALLNRAPDEPQILASGKSLLERLIARDDWLPEAFTRPDPDRYTQYLLYRDPQTRFSVVSFVWGPGQKTPIHDHTVWGLVGMLRGAELVRSYEQKGTEIQAKGELHRLEPGQVDAVSPSVGDIHQVTNAFDNRVSISIHVYGADIGAVSRHTYAPDGTRKTFISGYSNPDGTVLLHKSPLSLDKRPGSSVSPQAVRHDLLTRQEIAFLDLREEGPYALAHPLFAVNLPLSRLELEILDRVPRKSTKIILYDNGEGLTATAQARLAVLGYGQVHILEDGLAGWREAGLEIFQDVNSASKAFGELVESRRHTPSLTAPEVRALIDTNPNVVVLDARRFEEYHTMSIPKGVSVPGAELVLRARALAPDPATTIIVNCAGRTRSIIGTQSLINAGLPNHIVALRNGTIGWTLAGQALDHGQSRRFPEPSADIEAEARKSAHDVAQRAGVRWIDTAGLAALSDDRGRTLYRFDVRTPEEYAKGHLAGFRSAPGGQLVQETDVFAPVRGARLVLADDRGVRADMTASWLAQMGWEVYVLEGGFDGNLVKGAWLPTVPPPPAAHFITPEILAARLEKRDVVLIDLAPGPVYKRGHIPGAWFAIRARLQDALARLPQGLDFILTSPDGVLAQFAAPQLQALTRRNVSVLAGGTAAWTASAWALEDTQHRAASEDDDVYRRPYEGTDNAQAAMQAYLDWEYGLVEQLGRDQTHGFYVI